MATIPTQENFYWLFADTAKGLYEFTDFLPAYKTQKGKEVAVFVLTGEDTDGRMGDFLLTTFNIRNLNALRALLGENSDKWKGHLFEFKRHGDKQLDMIHVKDHA